MKKQFLLFILLLVFPIFISAETDKIEYFDKKIEKTSGARLENYFYKVDQDGNILSNAEFILKDLNNNIKFDVSYDSNKSVYESLIELSSNYNEILNFIPSNVKDIVLSFKVMEDFTPYIETSVKNEASAAPNPTPVPFQRPDFHDIIVDCKEAVPTEWKKSDTLTNYTIKKMDYNKKYEKCNVTIPTLLILEETKTPKGFEKMLAVTPATIKLTYTFGILTDEIAKVEASLINLDYFYNDYAFFEYDESLNYSDINETYNNFLNLDYSRKKVFQYSCMNPLLTDEDYESNSSIVEKNQIADKLYDNIGSDNMVCGAPIIIDKKGNSALIVNSYVNSKEEVNLTESSNVEIKVFLKNSGKAPSYENKVVSKVPEGVEYVAGSATDNGVYDEEKNTVTWDLDYLDASSGYIFSYEVAVTTGSKESVYVTTSSVSSEENETPIVSNEAKVTTPGVGGDAPEEEEEITNPKTGDERTTILVMLLIVSIGIFYYSFTKRTFKL